MKNATRKLRLLPLLLAACILLSGCMFTASVEDLYALPQMPEQYTDLEAQITALLASGAEYAAPVSGTNLQPVQMVDLDGDGQEEALIFLRNSADEKPLKIYVFHMEDDAYRQVALLEGSGTSIYSVSYSDLTGDGEQEILTGWRAGADTKALTVYSVGDFAPKLLLSTTYSRYSLQDMDGNGTPELTVLRADTEEGCLAENYALSSGGTLELRSAARLSSSAAELAAGRLVSGTLRSGEPALFVMGVSADSSTMLVDILARQHGVLVNITTSESTGYTSQSYHYLNLGPTDINGDGGTEIPVPLDVLRPGGGKTGCRIRWESFDADGTPQAAETTYHDTADGWYLVLPSSWEDRVVALRNESSTYESSVTFSLRGENENESVDFLRIYKFSGDNREVRANRGDRFILRTQQLTIYAAEFIGSGAPVMGLNADAVRAMFSLIATEWTAGDN